MPACWVLGRERTLLAILHVLSKFVRVGECSKTISQLLCIDKKHPPCVSHPCHSQREIRTNGHERIKCLQLFSLSLRELFQGSPYSHSGTLRAPSKRESSHVRSLPRVAPGDRGYQKSAITGTVLFLSKGAGEEPPLVPAALTEMFRVRTRIVLLRLPPLVLPRGPAGREAPKQPVRGNGQPWVRYLLQTDELLSPTSSARQWLEHWAVTATTTTVQACLDNLLKFRTSSSSPTRTRQLLCQALQSLPRAATFPMKEL